MHEDQPPPTDVEAGGVGGTAAAALSAVATAKPGMHDKHSWWHAAVAALAAHFTTALAPSFCSGEQGKDGAEGVQKGSGQATGAVGGIVGGKTVTGRGLGGVGGVDAQACMEDWHHDVGLVLQRALMVAMVCLFLYSSTDACAHFCHSIFIQNYEERNQSFSEYRKRYSALHFRIYCLCCRSEVMQALCTSCTCKRKPAEEKKTV